MSSFTIKVEVSPGTSILEACKEAKEKVSEWNVGFVEFKFNGVNVSIGNNSDPEDIAKKYLDNKIMGSGDYKFIL